MNPMDLQRPLPYQTGCCSSCRSPGHLMAVLRQFNVGNAPRYQPINGETFCNIFAWDASRALGAEIPHWWMGKELTANELHSSWFPREGSAFGWSEASPDDALAQASRGCPVAVTYANPKGHGHIALVMPVDADGDIKVAQAGRACGYGFPLNQAFGALPVKFWVHP